MGGGLLIEVDLDSDGRYLYIRRPLPHDTFMGLTVCKIYVFAELELGDDLLDEPVSGSVQVSVIPDFYTILSFEDLFPATVYDFKVTSIVGLDPDESVNTLPLKITFTTSTTENDIILDDSEYPLRVTLHPSDYPDSTPTANAFFRLTSAALDGTDHRILFQGNTSFKMDTFNRPTSATGGENMGYGSAPVNVLEENTSFVATSTGSRRATPQGALFRVIVGDEQALTLNREYGREGNFTGGVGCGSIFGTPGVVISPTVTSIQRGTASKAGRGAIIRILQKDESNDRVQQVSIEGGGAVFAGNTITLDIANDPVMGPQSLGCTPLVFTITEDMLDSVITSVDVTAPGKGFYVGDEVLLKVSSQVSGATDFSFRVLDAMLNPRFPEPLYVRAMGIPATNRQLLANSTDSSPGASYICGKLDTNGIFQERGGQKYGVRLTDGYYGQLSFYLEDGQGRDVAHLLGRGPKFAVEFKLDP